MRELPKRKGQRTKETAWQCGGVCRGGAGVTYYLTEVIKKSFGAATARRQPKYAHSVALKSSPPKLPPACRRGKNRIKRKREKKQKTQKNLQ